MKMSGVIIACVNRGWDKGDGKKPLHTYLVQIGEAVGKVWSTNEYKGGDVVDFVLATNNDMRFVVRVAK